MLQQIGPLYFDLVRSSRILIACRDAAGVLHFFLPSHILSSVSRSGILIREDTHRHPILANIGVASGIYPSRLDVHIWGIGVRIRRSWRCIRVRCRLRARASISALVPLPVRAAELACAGKTAVKSDSYSAHMLLKRSSPCFASLLKKPSLRLLRPWPEELSSSSLPLSSSSHEGLRDRLIRRLC